MSLSPNIPSKQKLFLLQYVGHIVAITGKVRDSILTKDVENISELLDKLDQKHPGIKETFMPPKGVFNSRTAIVLKRAGRPTYSVVREDEELHDGDTLTLW